MRGGVKKPVVLISVKYGGARAYPSGKDAAIAIGVSRREISESLRNGTEIGGFIVKDLRGYMVQ